MVGSKTNVIKHLPCLLQNNMRRFVIKKTKTKKKNSSIRKRKIHFIIHSGKTSSLKLFNHIFIDDISVPSHTQSISSLYSSSVVRIVKVISIKQKTFPTTHIQILRFLCVIVTRCLLQMLIHTHTDTRTRTAEVQS